MMQTNITANTSDGNANVYQNGFKIYRATTSVLPFYHKVKMYDANNQLMLVSVVTGFYGIKRKVTLKAIILILIFLLKCILKTLFLLLTKNKLFLNRHQDYLSLKATFMLMLFMLEASKIRCLFLNQSLSMIF